MIFIAHHHCFGMFPLHECNLQSVFQYCLPQLLTNTTHSSPTPPTPHSHHSLLTPLTPHPHHSLLTHTTHSSPTPLTPHPHLPQESEASYLYQVMASGLDGREFSSFIEVPRVRLRKISTNFVFWKDEQQEKVWGLNFSSERDTLKFLAGCTVSSHCWCSYAQVYRVSAGRELVTRVHEGNHLCQEGNTSTGREITSTMGSSLLDRGFVCFCTYCGFLLSVAFVSGDKGQLWDHITICCKLPPTCPSPSF